MSFSYDLLIAILKSFPAHFMIYGCCPSVVLDCGVCSLYQRAENLIKIQSFKHWSKFSWIDSAFGILFKSWWCVAGNSQTTTLLFLMAGSRQNLVAKNMKLERNEHQNTKISFINQNHHEPRYSCGTKYKSIKIPHRQW